jgi:hypothetical protein
MRQHATASKAATPARSASPSARETLGRKPSRGADRAAVTEARSGSQAGKLTCELRQQTLLSETTIGHDFSRIPVYSTDSATRPVAGLAPRVVFHNEKSVERPGEEEQTIDGGTPAPKAPAGCDAVPSSVQIKNVSPYRSGKLYGHRFDVEVALTYFAAASGPGTDAQLFWFEKTDRAPAWQGLSPNVWNDMFALFPTSPTFDGWTKNRTKPCPGSETATIHDPPSASVDLPARTLEFDIYVRGQQISHNARAKQVLEPDGAGGVKTQTFTILPSALGPLAGP